MSLVNYKVANYKNWKMMLLNSYNFNDKIKCIVPFKFITFIILIWIYGSNNDVSTYRNIIDNKFKHHGICNARSNRLLAKHEIQKNIKYKSHRENLRDYRMNKNTINENNKTNYEFLTKGLNKLDSYKKDYQRRHGKKKGLERLDCYYEKKIFDKIDHIYDLSKRMGNDKKTYKKYICSIVAIPFIIFSLLPFLGLIIPILFGGKAPKDRIVPWTTRDCAYKTGTGHCRLGFIHFSLGEIKAIDCLNWIISYILLMIVISVVIYTFIKIIKYEKLKAGKGKMGVKEYCRFCKDVLNNKIS